MHTRNPRAIVARLCGSIAAICLLVVAIGCGGGGSDASAGASAESDIPSSPPQIEIPEGLPPKKLVVKDLFEGSGEAAKQGDAVNLHYHCLVWGSGIQYASSWRYSGAPPFTLGSRLLLRGLDLGVRGMKEGGGREVLVPHTLLYYPEVSHPPVRPLESVICKTYLVKLRPGKRSS